MTHKEIAKNLGLSSHTVNAHIQAALKDLMTPNLAILILCFLL
jgi:DNA-binding NarL/FixJ family response regulator